MCVMNKLANKIKMVLGGLLVFGTLSAAPPVKDTINVINFNILAPCWADPNIYPASAQPYLDRTYRQGKIINFLLNNPTASIITLQEISKIEFDAIQNALKKDYIGFESFHDPSYWANYITVNPPWEPNGNAIFIKTSQFTNIAFQDIALSDDGNHAAYVEAIHKGTQKKIRAVSIHLDSDHAYNREREYGALLDFMTASSSITDIVGGDFNIDINNTNLQQDVTKPGFTNVLAELGIFEVTSPYSMQYYRNSVYGNIDHILVRNATPLDGGVVSNNLFVTYPDLTQQDPRITANFKLVGSDHFPVQAVVKIVP